MAEKKTLEERYADEVLTDNAALNHYSQCKDCIFRDKRVVGGEECGLENPGDKPPDIYDNTGQCEFYEKEKQK